MASRGCSCKIGVSMLNADMSKLGSECQCMLDCGADYLHLDVMDGHFVPNLTFGHSVVKDLRPKMPSAFFDLHMMVSNPEQWVENMADAGATRYIFHIEATDNPARCVHKIKEANMKVGIAINPKTPVEVVMPYIGDIDMIQVMSTEPGCGGQSFISGVIPKVQFLRKKCKDLEIAVDGGVRPEHVPQCVEAGASIIVSGCAIVESPNPKEVINVMRRAAEESIQKAKLERLELC